MIKTLRLENFKAFQDTGTLDLKPMTVLAGPNSGGKSSILQSLLLLKQTLAGPPDINLNLDGQYLQFSAFNELVFARPSLSKSEIAYQFDIETPIPTEIVPRYFTNLPCGLSEPTVPLRSHVHLIFRYNHKEQQSPVILHEFQISSQIEATKGPKLRGTHKAGKYKLAMTGKGVRRRPRSLKQKPIDTVHGRHFLPHYMVFEGDVSSDLPTTSRLGSDLSQATQRTSPRARR